MAIESLRLSRDWYWKNWIYS